MAKADRNTITEFIQCQSLFDDMVQEITYAASKPILPAWSINTIFSIKTGREIKPVHMFGKRV